MAAKIYAMRFGGTKPAGDPFEVTANIRYAGIPHVVNLTLEQASDSVLKRRLLLVVPLVSYPDLFQKTDSWNAYLNSKLVYDTVMSSHDRNKFTFADEFDKMRFSFDLGNGMSVWTRNAFRSQIFIMEGILQKKIFMVAEDSEHDLFHHAPVPIDSPLTFSKQAEVTAEVMDTHLRINWTKCESPIDFYTDGKALLKFKRPLTQVERFRLLAGDITDVFTEVGFESQENDAFTFVVNQSFPYFINKKRDIYFTFDKNALQSLTQSLISERMGAIAPSVDDSKILGGVDPEKYRTLQILRFVVENSL